MSTGILGTLLRKKIKITLIDGENNKTNYMVKIIRLIIRTEYR